MPDDSQRPNDTDESDDDSLVADRQLVQAAMELSAPSVAAVWDNPDDDVYNNS